MDATLLKTRRVVFVGDRTGLASVLADMRRTFEVEWIASLGDVGPTQPDALVLVGHAAWEARPPGFQELPAVALITRDAAVRRAAEKGLPPDVLIQDQDDDRLPEVVRRLLVPPILTERGRKALEALPPLLRRSLLLILEHPVPTLVEAVEAIASGRKPFAHARGAFAKRFGCSPDHLTRVARRHGLSWADLHRRALYLRMRHHRAVTGEPWADVFVRFGIGSPSAGTGFVKRVTSGSPPRATEDVALEHVRDSLFSMIEAQTLAAPGLRHTG